MDGSLWSDHSQAYFFGIFKKKKIVIYDTLIEKLSEKEIVAVLGHELGHWYYLHNMQMIGLSFLNTGFVLYLFSFMINNQWLYKDYGFTKINYFMGMNIFFLIYTPIAVVLKALLCYVSWKNEYQADFFAIKQGYGKYLGQGLMKLFKDNKANMDPDELYSLFHHTHPNLVERLGAINAEIRKLN